MNQPPYRSLQTVTLAIIVVGLIALALGGYLTPIFSTTMGPLVEAQTWLSIRFLAVRDYVTAPRDLASLREDNQQLESEIARLQTQIIQLQQQITDMQVLSALLDFARTNPENRYLAATIIGRDPSPFLHYLIINRGSDDGLRRGMPVVTAEGLAGRIAAVTPAAARVQLLTDPESSVNIRILPSNADAIMTGSLTGDLSLDQIPQEASVQPGDLVLSSGLGGGFPANILVGQISGVRSLTTDIFQRATIQPVVDFSQLDILLVITNFRPVDINPLIPGAPQ
jgi:rod shape-determining protein MreC